MAKKKRKSKGPKKSQNAKKKAPDPAVGTQIQIALPEKVVFNRKKRGNLILQLAEPGGKIDATYQGKEGKAYLLSDGMGRKLAIYPPRVSAKKEDTPYKLRAVSKLASLEDLNAESRLKWLSHPLADKTYRLPEKWDGSFTFVSERGSLSGLREPQLGAIHSIAAHWTAQDKSGLVVMPTGTGKTDTMISVLVHCQCNRVLVIVPSDALRMQTFQKFTRLGCLKEIGAVSSDTPLSRVALVKKSLRTVAQLDELVADAQVVIATASIISKCTDEVQKRLAETCSHLFVDEAHHVPARTWTAIKERFGSNRIILFTATPFRRDGKRIEGKIIYNYPLGRAQKKGYFKNIQLIPVTELDDDTVDSAIADKAVECLTKDLQEGHDHLLLARVKSIPQVVEVLKTYRALAPDHSPVAVHSKMTSKERAIELEKLAARTSRIVVCVDMLGEGFDLPALKIAAIHDTHKSLPVTLQFIGRFTRTAQNVSNATVIVNVADPAVDAELQTLYAQDANWNTLLRRSSEGRIDREVSFQELLDSFRGRLPQEVPLWNLRPSFSTIVFETTRGAWNSTRFAELLPEAEQCWHAVSDEKKVAVAVIARESDVKWGKYRDIADLTWSLILAFWDEELQLLFVFTDDYKSLQSQDLATALVGESATLLSGPRVFNIYGNVERPIVKNLGAAKPGSGNIRFTMYFGQDVTEGLTQVEKAESEASNLFGWGYENGDQITLGCATRKGKIWARGGGPIDEWQQWCQQIGGKLRDQSIESVEIVKGFLRPRTLASRHSQVPVGIEWGDRVIRQFDSILIYLGGREFSPQEVDFRLPAFSDNGPIKFEVVAQDVKAELEMRYGTDARGEAEFELRHLSGPAVSLATGSGVATSLVEWIQKDALFVLYANGSYSRNQFLIDAACPGSYPSESLTVLDWNGINIKKESQGVDREEDSIQYRATQELLDEFDVVIDDDGSGEAADIIGIGEAEEGYITLRLVHCKFSSEESPGARVEDFYELCGQAQKCIRWKHNGFLKLGEHIRKREAKWVESGMTRFIKGGNQELRMLEKRARRKRVKLEVVLVQPGLSKRQVSDPILHLLGSTQLFLQKTAEARFDVICSE